MTVSFVLDRLEKKGTDYQIIAQDREYDKILAMLEKFDTLLDKSDSNILLKDL